MPNPNENNNPVKNKEKANKEFAQENETPQKENINLESNYKSQGTKPVSINIERVNESRAVGNNTPKSTSSTGNLSDNPKLINSDNSSSGMGSGSLSDNPKLINSDNSSSGMGSGSLSDNPKLINSDNSSSGMGSGSLSDVSAPKDYAPKAPKGNFPKVDDAPPSSESGATSETGGGLSKEEKPSGNETKAVSSSMEKSPKKEEKILVSGELKAVFGVVQGEPKEDKEKVSSESVDEEGAGQIKTAKENIELEQNMNNNITSSNENLSEETGGGESKTGNLGNEKASQKTTEEKAKQKEEAEALGAFEIKETDEELKEDVEINGFKTEGKNHGLIVGRSMGYGAKITSSSAEDKPFDIAKFSENDDPGEEEAAKNKYNKENDVIAKNMELFGSEGSPEDGKEANPKKGYYDAYIEGYNEGHREGTALKKEAAVAERTAQMKKEQGTDEYMVGASLGMTCGILKAKGEKEVDTTFSMTQEGEMKVIPVKTTVAELDNAAFNKKQTPGGELSGPTYEKAFLLHYNMGYREAQNQRSQPPPMDEDYKLGYKQGYKLGSQKGNGEKGDKDLLKVEATNDAKNERELKKEELQQYRGFYVGYNKGYAQVQKAKKNKVQEEREAKYKKPNFVAGYSTGNLKGFLTAMVEPSGIDLLAALNDPQKMEAAGIPSFFPIPESLRKNIKATLVHGDVADNKNESDSTKALLGKPLFKEGLLMGYNQGYRQGQNSRASFKRDKHKMHPDYQRSTMVLMAGKDSGYTGPTESGASVTGFTMGQILANANFELYELTAKKGRSEKEEKRFEDLTKAVASINNIIAKENSYYKLGIDEFYNWWMGELAKKAQKKKSDEGYAGMKPSVKREGFDWGLKVGEKVVEAKSKLKEIKRKGRDIKSRSTELNNTIKKTDTKAKATSKNRGGEDYYIGYRNGYNHAFRVAKEGKKSDKGNLDTGDLLENAGNTNSQHINEIYLVITKDVSLGVTMGEPKFGEAIQSAKGKFETETAKAFEDGLSIGYNSGYSANVFDVKTGKVTTDKIKTDETKIEDKFKEYKKLKDDQDKIKYTENIALGVLYFFLIGYQFHNKGELKTKYGLPKGISDAESFNVGFQTGIDESKNGKIVDNSGDANSKDAYNAGYGAAKSRAQYEAFKKGMITSSLASTNEEEKKTGDPQNVKSGGDRKTGSDKGSENTTSGNRKNGGTERTPSTKESTVDENLTGGLALLADEETKKEVEQKKNSKGNEDLANKYYKKGNEDATLLWTKIIYLRKGVKLEDESIPDKIQFKKGGELITLSDDAAKAAEYYLDKDALIEEFAEDYVSDNFTWELFMSALALNFGALSDAWKNYDGAKEKEKQNYINGYKAKIADIESSYKEKFINDWLYDSGYYDAVTEIAPDTPLAMPSGPYTNMSGDERDDSSPKYKSGYLEGLKMGNLIKNGIVKPSASDLAGKGGGDATRGFEEGKKAGQKEGLLDAKNPDKKLPSEEDREDQIQKRLDEEYEAKHNGENDGMNVDYEDAYVEAYFSAYWEARDYEYGRLLGYNRGAKGGDDVHNAEPEKGIVIKNEDAFFRGFDAGREIGVLGLSKGDLYKEGGEAKTPKDPISVIQKITSKYAARNAAIDAIHELKLEEKTILKIVYSNDPFYKRYTKLSSVKALGIEDQSAGSMGALLVYYEVENLTVISEYLEEGFKKYLETSFVKCSSKERSSYWNAFKTSYEEAYRLAHAQSLSELIPVSMTAQFDQRKDVSVMGGGIDSGFNETEDSALDVLKDLLFGGTQDFHLDELLLLDMFYALETKIEEVQYYIEDDLEEIEFNRSLAGLYSGDDQKDYEDLAKLETELEEGNLTKKEKIAKRKEIKKLKSLIASKSADAQETNEDWEAAEAAAKEKIDSIRILMKDSLAFDTPLESNEDILTYIKINLESSKGNDEDVYENIDIFNDLFLTGSFNYRESKTIDASVLGDAYFTLDHYAENVYIDNANVLMKENGFEFKSRGMSYIKHDTVNFMSGSIVTPSIEGGAHMGEQYVYNFNDFSIHLGQGVKAQIDAQKHKLEGGPK